MTTEPGGDALALQDKFFQEKLGKIATFALGVGREATVRYWVAIALKGATLVGGFVVAAARNPTVSLVVGIAISLSLVVDQLTSNANLLLALTDAEAAVDKLREQVEAKHSAALPGIVDMNARGKSEEARSQLRDLLATLTSEIDAELKKIETKLVNARRSSIVALRIHRR